MCPPNHILKKTAYLIKYNQINEIKNKYLQSSKNNRDVIYKIYIPKVIYAYYVKQLKKIATHEIMSVV